LSNSPILTGHASKILKTESKERLGPFVSLRTGQFTKESGSLKRTRKIEEESRFGLMEADTMASGEMEWLTDREDWFMLKVTFMRENGLMTRPMVMVCTPTSMGQDTKDNGTRTSNMASGLNSGLMVLSTKGSTSRE
jgi:hypothetical protein